MFNVTVRETAPDRVVCRGICVSGTDRVTKHELPSSLPPPGCLLASIKLANYRLSFPFRSPVAFGVTATRVGIPELNENGNIGCTARDLAPPRYMLPLFHLLTSLRVLSCRSLFQPGDTELPPIYFPDRHGGSGSNLPCTTKWVPPAEKAAVCLLVTTRVALISLAYIRLDPRPFSAAFRKMQIFSSLVEIVP